MSVNDAFESRSHKVRRKIFGWLFAITLSTLIALLIIFGVMSYLDNGLNYAAPGLAGAPAAIFVVVLALTVLFGIVWSALGSHR